MSRRVKIPYHIPGGASGFLLMDVDTASGVSMPTNATNASSSSGFSTIIKSYGYGASDNSAAGSYSLDMSTLGLTTDTCLGYLSMSGGGGGGGGGGTGTAPGGGGGGPSPQIDSLPVILATTGTLTIFVGNKGTGGAANADGTDGTESYIQGSCILSPYRDASDYIRSGYGLKGSKAASGSVGGNGGIPAWSSTAVGNYGTANTGSSHAAQWFYLGGSIPVQYCLPVNQASGGGNVNVNAGSIAGLPSLNGNGLGSPGYGDATGGGGGGGGGSSICRGGAGGTYQTPTAGQVGSGPGAGGGGGFGNSAGGDGTIGYVTLIIL